jgi:hypothetical protein
MARAIRALCSYASPVMIEVMAPQIARPSTLS